MLDYNVINKDELARALADLLPEFNRFDDVKKCQAVDRIAETLGSRGSLCMLFSMAKRDVIRYK